MLISLDWLRCFVELPAEEDPRALAERLTLTCAEVEGVEHINIGAIGLICARVESVSEIPGTSSLRRVRLDTGTGETIETISTAPVIREGDLVLYAPPGAKLAAVGEIGHSQVGGQASAGLIVSGDSVGISAAIDEVVTLPPNTPLGKSYDPELFDDWVIEIDNKAITHRPDLWGHYGFAREIAAMYGVPLGEYPVVPAAELQDDSLPSIPIQIDDSDMCPRYTGLRMRGVVAQPSPLWMQLRLGHVGMRPIDALVDLTNYIMAELGQPMHAFDGDRVSQIEVGCAKSGDKFITLDGTERTLPAGALMIMRERHPVALAGIMGGLETEVSQHTRAILLESANFEPATIRRTATAIGLRTEASTRFEKSLDPAYTVLAVQRFVYLARQQCPSLEITSSLSDCYPRPVDPVVVDLDPEFVRKVIGHPVTDDEIKRILRALEFTIDDAGQSMRVTVPSFRATKDVQTEVDLIEEICRSVGYKNITPSLPEATVRCFKPNPIHTLEHDTLRYWCGSGGYHEIYGYIWDDVNWNRQLGYAPGDSHELRNPAGAGLQFLRQSLIPGMLAAADRNRHHFDEFYLAELGSVFLPRPAGAGGTGNLAGPDGGASDDTGERKRIGLVAARRSKKAEAELLADLKGTIEAWTLQVLGAPTWFDRADAALPWEHPVKTAIASAGGKLIGRLGVVPLPLRQRIDDHLAAWSIVWAELDLVSALEVTSAVEMLPPIPSHPQAELDFSFLVPLAESFKDVRRKIAEFRHPLLQSISYVGSYEGKSTGSDRRSLTFHLSLGAESRTLTDDDLAAFRAAFQSHLDRLRYALRS